MSEAERLRKKWTQHIPPRVPLSEFKKLAEHYFETRPGGKEPLIVYSIAVKDFYLRFKDQYGPKGLQGYIKPFNHDGEFSVGAVSGKAVKAKYVRNILDAIEKHEEIAEFLEGHGG